MPTVVQSRQVNGGVNVGFNDDLTVGHLILMYNAMRQPNAVGAAPKSILTGQGWIYLGECINTTGFDRGGAWYYKYAEAVDENWDITVSDNSYVLIETDATVLTPIVAATADTAASSASMNSGGTVTPDEGDDVLIIGGATVGNSDSDYDGAGDAINPYASVVEIDETWGNVSPLMWVGYIEDSSASGSYIVGGTNERPRAYCGMTLLIASSPPPPAVTPPLVCALDDADLSELVCIDSDDLIKWSIRPELQGTGSGFIEIHRSHLAADTDVIKKGNWLAVKIPQIDFDVIFVFQMERITTTLISADEGGGETVKVAGRGNLSYFDRAIAMPRTWASGSGESDLSVDGIINGPAATGNKAGQVLERAMREWQHVDRGVTDFGLRLEPIAHVTHDFDYDDDSSGDPWDTTDMTGELSLGYVGEKGLVGILELIGTGAIDIIIWPTFLLQAFNAYGRDLTGGAFGTGVVRFERGVNISEQLVRDEGLVVDPTHTVVQGSDGTVAAWAFAESPVFGAQAHVEGHVTTFGTDDTALEAVGVAEMARRIRQGESIQFRVATPRFGQDPDPENGLYLPGPEGTNGNYWLGDHVTLHTGSGFRDYAELSVRVMAITITSDDAGDLEVTVELKGTTFTGRLIPSAGSAGSFGGGSGGGGAGGTGGSTPPPPPGGAGIATHVADAVDAHDASAISYSPTGTIASTDVQAAVAEVSGDHTAHLADGTDAHDASAISVDGSGFTELDSGIDDMQEFADAVDAAIAAAGGGGGAVDVDIFTSVGNATWTKPTCTVVRVICIGGGGGGGSGRKGTGTRLGGGGGGGGGMTVKTFLAADLGSTEKLTVGGGGGGGTSQSTNNSNGNPGTAGNPSFFGNSVDGTVTDAKAIAGGGFGGASGTNSSNAPAGVGFGNVASAVAYTGGYASETVNDLGATIRDFFAGGATSVQSAAARNGSWQYACGGGGGGGAVITATERAGGAGGVPAHRAGIGAVAGGAAHLPGSNGTNIAGADTLAPGGYGGSGGGGSNSGSPAPGGNGGLYGGGGGGGGAGTDSVVNSGAGGDGANGIVVVISW